MADFTYYQHEWKRRIPLLWKDFDASIINFAEAGWTYVVQLSNDDVLTALSLQPTVTGFGPNAIPNLTIRWATSQFALITPKVYDLLITATKDGEPFTFFKTHDQVPTLEVKKTPV